MPKTNQRKSGNSKKAAKKTKNLSEELLLNRHFWQAFGSLVPLKFAVLNSDSGQFEFSHGFEDDPGLLKDLCDSISDENRGTIELTDREEKAIRFRIKEIPNSGAKNSPASKLMLCCQDVSECSDQQALEIKRQADFLQTMIDAIPSPIFYKDNNARYLGCNKRFEKYLGLKREDIVGKSVFDLTPDADTARIYHRMDAKLLENPGIQVYESTITFSDGSVHDVIFNKATFNDAEGETAGIIGVILDITSRKQAENALKLYMDIVNHMQMPLVVFKLDDYKDDNSIYLVSSNPIADEVSGLASEKTIGKRMVDVFPILRDSELVHKIAGVIRSGRPDGIEALEFEFGPRRKGIFAIRMFPLPNDCAGVVYEDIRNRKLAEEQLKQRLRIEEALSRASRLFVEPDEVDLYQALEYLGKAVSACRAYIFEVKPNGILNNTREWCADGISSQSHNFQNVSITEFDWSISHLQKGENVIISDISTMPAEAEKEMRVFLEHDIKAMLVVPIFSSDKRLLGFMGFDDTKTTREWSIIDIQALRVFTEMVGIYWVSRETKIELQQNEKRMRAAFDNAPVGIAELMPDCTILRVNQRFAEIMGYQPAQLHGLNLSEITHQEDVASDSRLQADLLNGLIDTYTMVKRYIKRNGDVVWVKSNASTIGDEHDVPSRIILVLEDITARKRAQEELKNSLALIRATLESTSDGVLVLDRDSNMKYYNTRFLDMWDIPDKFIEEVDKNQIIHHIASLLENPRAITEQLNEIQVVSCESRNIQLNLTNGRIFELTVLPQIVAGQTNGRVLSFHDVTHRNKTEEMLSKIVQQYTSIIDTVPAQLYAKDSEYRYLVVNDQFCRERGFERDEVIGKTDYDLLPTDVAERYNKMDRQVLEHDDKIINLEEKIQPNGDSASWMSVTKVPMLDENGNIDGIVGLIQDVTEQRRGREQLMQSDKLAAIGTLAAGVAHEINNPMGYISSNLNTMKKYLARVKDYVEKHPAQDQDEFEDMKDIIEDFDDAVNESIEGTGRVKSIVADLKSFSRVDKSEYESADLNEGISSTLNIVWNELKYHCKVETDLGELPDIHCIPNQINQIFMNLLLNAGQAINHKEGLIKIKSWADDNNINVTISDNGSGIPEDKLEKIFEPFYTTKEVGKGTGLGLSLVYDIIRKHKGNIEVESTVGKGSTFLITLPREGINE